MNVKKINETFLERFISLESLCAMKLGVHTTGITEYISRLNMAKSAEGREETLRRLSKYRNIRNRLVHENKALKSLDEISSEDIKWLRKFEKSVKKKKDPLSVYLKKSKQNSKKKIIAAVLIAAGIVAVAIGAYIFLL